MLSSNSQSTSLESNRASEGERVIAASTDSTTQANAAPFIERLGSQLIVTGTPAADRIRIVPAENRSVGNTHVIEVNGQRSTYEAVEIDSILVLADDGSDELIVEDTPGDDRLNVERERLIFENDDLRVEAIAVELVRALSNSGGRDQVDGESDLTALDYVLQLQGDWDRAI